MLVDKMIKPQALSKGGVSFHRVRLEEEGPISPTDEQQRAHVRAFDEAPSLVG